MSLGSKNGFNVKTTTTTATTSRSPRWSSGSPRMLLVLVREFESRRGEILNLFAKVRKDQLLRAPRVCNRNSTGVDEGRPS